jgi:very-short-patch-repair endonuclease
MSIFGLDGDAITPEGAETLSPTGRGKGEGGTPSTRQAPDLTPLARRLRRSQTDAERLLWSKLRNRGLGRWKFRRQMPIGRYIVDFCCPDAWLIVELDGGQHSFEAAAAKDLLRTCDLERCGYLVLRFWNREVTENLDGVCETILAAAQGRG